MSARRPPPIRSIRVEHENGKALLTLPDGRQRTTFLDPKAVTGHDKFSSTELSFADNTLEITTWTDETFIVEVSPGGGELTPRRGRRVVYLDQNHWIYLARALNGSAASDDVEKVAVMVAKAVESGQLILPLSSAHHTETGFKDGPKRQTLAATMLSLSRGWVMKHPIQVRRDELRGVIRGQDLSETDKEQSGVISTVQWRQYNDPALTPDVRTVAHFPPFLRRWWVAVVSVVAAYDYLLDPEGEDVKALKKSAEGWASELWEFAKNLAADGLSSSERRGRAFQKMVDDMRPDIQQSYVDVGGDQLKVGEWLKSVDQETFSRAPYLGRWFSVFGERLANPEQPWAANDLLDLLYLPCAAAYCDVVVAEKSAAHYLSLAGKELGGAVIASKLTELPHILEDAG